MRAKHAKAPGLEIDYTKAKLLQSLVDKYVGKADFIKTELVGGKDVNLKRPAKFQWEINGAKRNPDSTANTEIGACAWEADKCYTEAPARSEGYPDWYYRLKTKDTSDANTAGLCYEMSYYVELDATEETTAYDLLTAPEGVAPLYWYAGQDYYDYTATTTGGAPM
jgi:hypothetical protein